MIVGLDIGGANLKAAHLSGRAHILPFALWKDPGRLPRMLQRLLEPLPPARFLAVTMTGELCDCFASCAEGVSAILSAISQIADTRIIKVWTKKGCFVDLAEVRTDPLSAGAANWLAIATWAAKFIGSSDGLLMDMGSTTTDIVPLLAGQPRPRGISDPERLRARELVYCGARRTPVCALLGLDAAAEWFATTLDVYLVLGMLAENPQDVDTADGRPATRQAAHARLAHMLCGDAQTVTLEETQELARRAMQAQVDAVSRAAAHVASAMPRQPETIVLAGSGEFLARHCLPQSLSPNVVSLTQKWGPELSQAACAYALAQLAAADVGA